MRRSPLVALVLGAVLLGLALAPSARAQATPSLNPITDFRVTAVDTNGNGKYDALVGTFNATVTVAGNFRFSASLVFGFAYAIVTNNTDLNLDLGSHTLSVSIPGPAIYTSGYNGPYDFRLDVDAVTDQGAILYYAIPTIDNYTAAYNSTDFEPPWAYIGSPITDAGVDTDGDGLFNALVVHVPIVVNRSTYVQVQGYLGTYYTSFFSEPTEPLYLTPGTHTLDLTWDGMALRTTPYYFAGLQTVQIQMFLPKLMAGSYPTPSARTTYTTTHSYAQSQFEQSSASIATSSVTTTLQDTNGNGLADFLVFHLPIVVRAEGDYAVIVVVTGGMGGTTSLPEGVKIVHLLPGNTTVDVPVSGIALNRLNTVSAAAIVQVSRLGTGYYDTNRTTWSLPNFQSSAFESRSVSTLTVSMTPSNMSCGFVYIWDPANRYLAYASAYGGYSGSISAPLYDGTFYVVALGCGYLTSAAGARKVTVSGPTTIIMNLSAEPVLNQELSVNVPSWNSTDVRTSSSMGGASALYRLIADVYGNADGSADSTELANIGKVLALGYGFVGLGYGGPREDNRSLPFLSRFSISLTGAGEITSTSPLTYTAEYVSITKNPPIPGDHHRLVVRVPYSTPSATTTVTVALGASVGGNLSMVSRMIVSDGDGFTWPANATATKTGPQSWSIAVGQAPPNEPPYVMLEIVVDGYGTPTPQPPSLLDYIANPLGVSLIVVAVAGVAIAVATRRKRQGPAPPA